MLWVEVALSGACLAMSFFASSQAQKTRPSAYPSVLTATVEAQDTQSNQGQKFAFPDDPTFEAN